MLEDSIVISPSFKRLIKLDLITANLNRLIKAHRYDSQFMISLRFLAMQADGRSQPLFMNFDLNMRYTLKLIALSTEKSSTLSSPPPTTSVKKINKPHSYAMTLARVKELG